MFFFCFYGIVTDGPTDRLTDRQTDQPTNASPGDAPRRTVGDHKTRVGAMIDVLVIFMP